MNAQKILRFNFFLGARAEILKKISLVFGRNDNTRRTFRNQLTFNSMSNFLGGFLVMFLTNFSDDFLDDLKSIILKTFPFEKILATGWAPMKIPVCTYLKQNLLSVILTLGSFDNRCKEKMVIVDTSLSRMLFKSFLQ